MNNFLKISDATSIGLHAMVEISMNTELKSVKAISEKIGASSNHLSKVLQKLVKADLLISNKGYNGGFILAKKMEDISFLEIYEAIEGEISLCDCLLKRNKSCDECIMGDLLKSINKQVIDYFSKTTLADIYKRLHKNNK
jgi:Rrf2 family protein